MLSLAAIERRAAARGLLLRLQVTGQLGLRSLRVVVAQPRAGRPPLLIGELKGWALPNADGLQLDTLRVQGEGRYRVGVMIWAASFAWALESTSCRTARLLAIRDDDAGHRKLVRYFERLGFTPVRQLGAGPVDLALRLVWGGSGLLMRGDCRDGLQRCERLLGTTSPPPLREDG